MKTEHVGICVEDLQKTIAWYHQYFGFEVVKEFEKAELEFKGVTLKSGESVLEMLAPYHPEKMHAQASNLPQALRSIGTNHFAVAIERIDETYNKMKSAGAGLITDLMDGRFFFVRDPDGTLIEVRKA